MAIQYGPGYNPSQQGGGLSFPTVDTWGQLASLEPATPGLEVIINQGIPTSLVTGRCLARRGASIWGVPGLDASGLSYLNSHMIPLTSPTIPQPREWVGSNLAMQGSAYDVSFLGGLVGDGAATSITFAVEIKNSRLRKVKAARILVSHIEGSNGATISARMARKGTGSITAPQGAWTQATFNGSTSITPTNGSYSFDHPWYGFTDEMSIVGGIGVAESMVVWVTLSGGSNKRVSMPLNNSQETGNGNWGKPSVYGPANLCYGNWAMEGVSGTPTWSGSDYGNPVALIQWIYDETDNASTVVCGLGIGDSVWAGLPPMGQSRVEDWAEYTTIIARTNNKRYAIQSGGQGAHSIPQIRSRVEALLASGFGTTIDFLMCEAWSWNNPPADNTALLARQADIAAMKSACDTANIAFIAGMLCPPGTGNASAGNPFSVSMSSDQLTQFNEMRSHIASTYKYVDIVSEMEDPGNPNHFTTQDSGDDVHAYSGSADNQIGQYKQALHIGPKLEAALTSFGYVYS